MLYDDLVALYLYLSPSLYVSLCVCVYVVIYLCGLWAFSSKAINSNIDNSFPLKPTPLLLNKHTKETPWSRFH